MFVCVLVSTCTDGGDDVHVVSPDSDVGGEQVDDSCFTDVASSNITTESPFLIMTRHSHGLKIRTGTCSRFGSINTRATIAPERRKT